MSDALAVHFTAHKLLCLGLGEMQQQQLNSGARHDACSRKGTRLMLDTLYVAAASVTSVQPMRFTLSNRGQFPASAVTEASVISSQLAR